MRERIFHRRREARRTDALRAEDGGLSDFAIRAAGMALAFAACAFAYGELGNADGAPKIYGMDHLALFAQPARLRDQKLGQDAASKTARGVDYAPTATVGRNVERYPIFRVERDLVVLRGPDGLFAVSIGETAPGRGRLVGIVGGEGAWRPQFAPDSAVQTSR